jgi:hypothetical protein
MPTGVRAYAVTVKGMEGGRVVDDIYELDYRAHTRELKRNAQHVATVSLTFEDGTEAQMPYGEYESRRRGLIHRHGVITEFRREPKDEGALQAALSAARERRERDSRPAAFKAGIQHGKKPSVRQQLSESRRQLDKKRAAAPQKARARPHERAV